MTKLTEKEALIKRDDLLMDFKRKLDEFYIDYNIILKPIIDNENQLKLIMFADSSDIKNVNT